MRLLTGARPRRIGMLLALRPVDIRVGSRRALQAARLTLCLRHRRRARAAALHVAVAVAVPPRASRQARDHNAGQQYLSHPVLPQLPTLTTGAANAKIRPSRELSELPGNARCRCAAAASTLVRRSAG